MSSKRTLPANASVIPENAKRVFKGKIFDIYQWEQERFDGSKGLWEMIKRPDTVSIISIVDDKVVIVKEKQPYHKEAYFNIPMGRVDEDEDIEVAAKRELKEETGLIMKDFKLVDVYQHYDKIEWFVFTYIATGLVEKGKQELDPGGEEVEVMRISFKEFIEYLREGKIEIGFLVKMLLRDGDEAVINWLKSFIHERNLNLTSK